MASLLFSLILLCISFIITARGQDVGIEGSNPNFNYDWSCQYYYDCHNCTVSRCRWNHYDNKCHGYAGYNDINLHKLQIDDFFKHAK